MSELKIASCFEFEKVLSGKSNKLFYSKSEVDAVLAEKDKEIAELKEQYKDMDVTHTVHIAKMNARIEELEDNVDFWKKEIRRLKRALYKACANWAMAESYSVLNDVPTANRWVHTLRKLKAKLEKYK